MIEVTPTTEGESKQPTTIEFDDRYEMSKEASQLMLQAANRLEKLVERPEEVRDNLVDINSELTKITTYHKFFSLLNKVKITSPEEMKMLIDAVVLGLGKQNVVINNARNTIPGLANDGLSEAEYNKLASFYHDFANDLNRFVSAAALLEESDHGKDDKLLTGVLAISAKGMHDRLKLELNQKPDRQTSAKAFLDVAASLVKELKLYAPDLEIKFNSINPEEFAQVDLQEYQTNFHPVALRGVYINALQNILRINQAKVDAGESPKIDSLVIQTKLVKSEPGQLGVVITLDDNGDGFPLDEQAVDIASLLDEKKIKLYQPKMGKTKYSDSVQGTGVALASLESELQDLGGDLLLGNLMSENGQALGARVELHVPFVSTPQPAAV